MRLHNSSRLAWVKSVLQVVLSVFLACVFLRCDYLRDLSAGRHRGAFNLLTPLNDATWAAVAGDLTWEAVAGNEDYDVYLGTTSPPPLYQANVGNVTTYAYSGLASNTKYYWRVVAKNAGGGTPSVAEFGFTTMVSAALTLREVASYDTPGFAYDVVIAGNHAYVADSSALLVLDVENPASPREVGRVVVGHMLWNVSLVGNYACVADRLGDLHVIDVSSDTSPQQVGQIWPGTIGRGIVGILAEGSFAYCTTEDGRFCIVDISKPDSLFLVSRLDRYGSGKIWQLAKYGNYVYAVGYMGLSIFDVSVPEAPVEVGGFYLGDMLHDSYGPYFRTARVGNLLYLSDGDLRTLDLTNPTSPADAGTIGVYSYVYGVAAQDSLVCFANSSNKPEAESLFVLANDVKASVNTRLPGYSIAITGDYIYLATGRQGVKVFHLERQ